MRNIIIIMCYLVISITTISNRNIDDQVREVEYFDKNQAMEIASTYDDTEILAQYLATIEGNFEEKREIAAIITSRVDKNNFSNSLKEEIIQTGIFYDYSYKELQKKKPTEQEKEIAEEAINGKIDTKYTSYMYLYKESDIKLDDLDVYRTENYIFSK